MHGLGDPEYGCELEPIDFVKVAEGCGIQALRIEDPKTCASSFAAPWRCPGPCLIEAVVDPHTPPMPPKIKPDQALHFAEALAKGTPHGGRIALTVASDTIRELI